jgi:hypothetical protein
MPKPPLGLCMEGPHQCLVSIASLCALCAAPGLLASRPRVSVCFVYSVHAHSPGWCAAGAGGLRLALVYLCVSCVKCVRFPLPRARARLAQVVHGAGHPPGVRAHSPGPAARQRRPHGRGAVQEAGPNPGARAVRGVALCPTATVGWSGCPAFVTGRCVAGGGCCHPVTAEQPPPPHVLATTHPRCLWRSEGVSMNAALPPPPSPLCVLVRVCVRVYTAAFTGWSAATPEARCRASSTRTWEL